MGVAYDVVYVFRRIFKRLKIGTIIFKIFWNIFSAIISNQERYLNPTIGCMTNGYCMLIKNRYLE